MGLLDGLKKMGIVQDDMSDAPIIPESDYGENTGPEVDIELDSIGGQDAEAVVQSVYSQEDFSSDVSIFRMQEFIDSLPAEMPTQTKYATIRGVLNASRVNVMDLITDAEKRITLLGAAHDGVKSEHEKLCEEANGHIADFMAAIEAAKVKMQDSQSYTTQTCNILEEEAVKVRKLLEFAQGVVDTSAGG